MSDTGVKFPIEIVDKWGNPLRKFHKDVDALNRVKTKDPFRDMPKSLGQLRRDLERYKNLQAESFRSSHIKRYGHMIDATERKINRLEKATGTCGKKTSRLFGGLKSMTGIGGAQLAIGGITAGIFKMGNEAVRAAGRFEKYQVTLKTMLGSQGAARERMDEYAKIAATTPFQISQVVNAGNQLQAIGRYSKDNLTMLGDLAAASGKPIEQVMNAYAKLSTGQKGEGVNMFRDLLISSQDWADATGKGIKKNGELAATTEEMIGALPKILKKKGFFGMMDEQARTTEGRISNLGDSFQMLKVAVGERMKPAFDNFVGGTTEIIDNMRRWVEVPTAQKIANEKAELNSLVGIITDANTGEEQRSDLIKKLQQQYPEFLKGLDAETVKNEELRSKLVQVNKQYENKMRLAAMSDLVSEEERELQQLQAEKVRTQTFMSAGEKIEQIFQSLYNALGGDEEYGKAQHTGMSKKEFVLAKYGSDDYRRKSAAEGDEESEKLLSLMQNWRAYSEIYNANRDFFGNRDLDEIEKEIKQLETVIDVYKKNMNAEQRSQSLSGMSANLLSGMFVGNSDTDGGYSPVTGLDLDNASATITGGAHNVKQIHINIESLIGENTNMFQDGESPDDADDFMTKLTNALQMIVNDTNYAAN